MCKLKKAVKGLRNVAPPLSGIWARGTRPYAFPKTYWSVPGFSTIRMNVKVSEWACGAMHLDVYGMSHGNASRCQWHVKTALCQYNGAQGSVGTHFVMTRDAGIRSPWYSNTKCNSTNSV